MMSKHITFMTTEHIGMLAGQIWDTLNKYGPLTPNKLEMMTEATRKDIHFALGWLAREDKINFTGSGRSMAINLK